MLVVDDEPLVRAFASEGLKGLGYQVLVAENGVEALQIYEENHGKIDCVLLDLIMPELSGLETYRRLRVQDPQVRVVFASGYSTGRDSARRSRCTIRRLSLESLIRSKVFPSRFARQALANPAL